MILSKSWYNEMKKKLNKGEMELEIILILLINNIVVKSAFFCFLFFNHKTPILLFLNRLIDF